MSRRTISIFLDIFGIPLSIVVGGGSPEETGVRVLSSRLLINNQYQNSDF